MLMTTKQKMPKLCIGARVCHTELLGSIAVQTGISVRAKSRSTINSKITAPDIYNEEACTILSARVSGLFWRIK